MKALFFFQMNFKASYPNKFSDMLLQKTQNLFLQYKTMTFMRLLKDSQCTIYNMEQIYSSFTRYS